MAGLLKQSSTAQPLTFFMTSSTDHITGATGLSPTVTLSKAGGAFASPAGAVSEIGNGWYQVAGNATDTNTLGPLLLHATATGADASDEQYDIVAFNPQSASAMITGVNNLAPPTNWNLMAIDGSGRIDLGKWIGVAPAALTTNGYLQTAVLRWLTDNAAGTPNALVLGKVDALNNTRTGTAQAAAAGSITLDSGASATDNLYKDQLVYLLSQTGAGQVRLITGYTGSTKVATVTPNWTTNPDSTSVFAVLPMGLADVVTWLASVPNALISGRVDANAAAVAVTVGTNNDKAGYSLTAGEHTNIASDAQTGLTAQGYTTTRAGYLDTLNGLVAAIWNALTSGMTTAGSIGLKLKNWVLGTDNKALLSTDAQTGVVLPRVTLVDTLTTYTGDTPQTGDSYVRLGAPAGASVSADIAAVNTLNVEMNGLLGKNSGMRNAVYSSGNLASYDLCLYDSSAHATTNDGATGLLHKYSVANTFDGSNNLLTSVTTKVS